MAAPSAVRRFRSRFARTAGTVLIPLAAATALWGSAGWLSSPRPSAQQPIAFDHQRHVSGKDGIKCVTCHTSVATETFANLPQVDTCMNCHAIVTRMSPAKLAKKPELGKLKQFVPVGFIPWRRIYREPEYVFFSHRRHVSVAKLDCATCHGDMSKLKSPPVQPAMVQSMAWCESCHEQRQASQDCISCHK